MENQKIPSIKPQISTLPSVDDLLERAWQIYKARLGTFLGIALFPVIIEVLFLIPKQILRTLSPIFVILFSIIFYLISIIIYFWSKVSLLYAIKEREQKIGIKESFRKGWHKMIPFVWISLLSGFICTGGFMLLIVPGIVFSVWFAFSNFVLVSEELRGMNAILRSKQLVSGYWWKVFWRLLVIELVIFIISFGITFPFRIFVNKTITDITKYFFYLLLTPFYLTYSFLLYEDLRKLKAEIPFEAPKRGTRIKYILIGVIGFLLIPVILVWIVLTSLSGARARARDARRENDIRQIVMAMEMCYGNEVCGVGEDQYLITSAGANSVTQIGPYLTVPRDPLDRPPYQYTWTAGSSQYYCVYVKLENPADTWLCGSNKGVMKKTASNYIPSNFDCCGMNVITQVEKPSIKVIFPNGGEKLVIGQTYDITWEVIGNINKVNIGLIEGSSHGFIPLLASDIPAATKKFTWKINKTPGDKYKIYISDAEGSGVEDYSDNYFSIIPSATIPYIKILSPNGGEKWEIGKTYRISWESRGIDKVAIGLIGGPELLRNIALLSDNPGFYDWTIPTDIAPNNEYRIFIAHNDIISLASDESDDYFSIVSQTPSSP